MILKVCVGSACHVKGSYEVIETFNRLIIEERLEDRVELKACFCLNNCTQGVSVTLEGIDETLHFTGDTHEDLFRDLLKKAVL